MKDAIALVGDCRAIPLPDASVDAVVTDPPYGLSFMGKGWDHDVPGPDHWREVKRVMKPGAHLLAFGGTRTFHWLAVALEEVGFDIRDTLSWLYGSGFPKSHDISKAIDKTKGAERKTVGPNKWEGLAGSENTNTYGEASRAPETIPATEAAKMWDGFGTALKPAWEPIILAMKSTDGTFAENALEHGVAGLNIDGCRIGVDAGWSYPNGRGGEGWMGMEGFSQNLDEPLESTDGRWPANVTLSHTPWCRKVGTKRVEGTKPPGPNGQLESPSHVYGDEWGGHASPTYEGEDGTEEVEDWSCPPSCPVRMLDEQAGNVSGPRDTAVRGEAGYGFGMDRGVRHAYDDTGGPSRFYYCSKASRGEREAGLPSDNGNRANRHPTVKPIDLCRWLVRLVARKDHLVLDPFMGSGSIGCAALIERRRFVGLDLNPEYVEIARARLEHWTPKQVDLFLDAEDAA